MIDTMRGPAQVIQIVGRAVRKSPGKTVGTIVLPVLVADGQDAREALARSEHRPIMNLLASPSRDRSRHRAVGRRAVRVQVDPDTGEAPKRRRFVLAIPTEVGPEFADAVNVMLVEALAPGPGVNLPAPTTAAHLRDLNRAAR